LFDSSVKRASWVKKGEYHHVNGECGQEDCHGCKERVRKVPLGGKVIGGGPGVERYWPPK